MVLEILMTTDSRKAGFSMEYSQWGINWVIYLEYHVCHVDLWPFLKKKLNRSNFRRKIAQLAIVLSFVTGILCLFQVSFF